AKNKVAILDKKSYFDSYASCFMNSAECSVRFNGYITLSREF
ncbi:Shiga toxin A subunit, partial [Salmonella enterica subsp. enterica serovar Typhimurium]